MTHIITTLCVRDRGCIDVCLVECMVPGQPVNEWPWIYIDPDTCIDCGACVPECPVTAIFPNEDVPEGWREYIDKNADYFKLGREDFDAKWRPQEEETYVTKARAEGVKPEGVVDTLDYAGYELEIPAE